MFLYYIALFRNPQRKNVFGGTALQIMKKNGVKRECEHNACCRCHLWAIQLLMWQTKILAKNSNCIWDVWLSFNRNKFGLTTLITRAKRAYYIDSVELLDASFFFVSVERVHIFSLNLLLRLVSELHSFVTVENLTTCSCAQALLLRHHNIWFSYKEISLSKMWISSWKLKISLCSF